MSPVMTAVRPQQTPMDEDVDDTLRARQAFFAAATHDLKTPLSSLTLWMDTLEVLRPRLADGADSQAGALLQQALEQMQTLVRRSVHLVDDVLDVMRLEGGRPLPFTPREVDMVALARQTLEERPDTDHPLRLESAASELWGWWDEDRLARLVENLVANAIKYSPAGRPVTVRLWPAEGDVHGWAVLEVEDRGIGIPAADLPRISEPFHRAPNVTPTVPGDGLGLWGSRTIVEQHSGTLAIASREGEGTTVTVRLPRAPRSPAASALGRKPRRDRHQSSNIPQ
jgi:signal transduction histidine kinase